MFVCSAQWINIKWISCHIDVSACFIKNILLVLYYIINDKFAFVLLSKVIPIVQKKVVIVRNLLCVFVSLNPIHIFSSCFFSFLFALFANKNAPMNKLSSFSLLLFYFYLLFLWYVLCVSSSLLIYFSCELSNVITHLWYFSLFCSHTLRLFYFS